MKKILQIFLLISLLVAPGAFVRAADEFPAWPMCFYGTAKLDGSALPVGAEVYAYAGESLIGTVELTGQGTYGYVGITQAKLLVGEYAGDTVEFRFRLPGGSEILSGSPRITYGGNFIAGQTVLLNLDFKSSASSSGGSSSGGYSSGGYSSGGSSSGGSSSGRSTAPSSVGTNISSSAGSGNNDSIEPMVGAEITVKGMEHAYTDAPDSLYGVDGDRANQISLTEARSIQENNSFVAMGQAGKDIFSRVTSSLSLSDVQKYSIAYFIENGSHTTKRLGAGERAGSLNSFISAYGTAPQSETDWQDVIKIANGRWPARTSSAAETRALEAFTRIYLRPANMADSHDNAAVTVIAYGLRPANRNLDSEAAAIRIFKNIFKYNPSSATDWDSVRAIAYSGATR